MSNHETSDSFKRAEIADGGYIPLALLRITHPDIPRITRPDGTVVEQVVRVVRDNQPLTKTETRTNADGDEVEEDIVYYPLPFNITRPTSRDGELPVLELTIDRLDGTIADLVDLTGGAKDAEVEFIEIDRNNPNTEERVYKLQVKKTTMTMSQIVFTLSFPNLFKIPSVQQAYYPSTNPGLFQ